MKLKTTYHGRKVIVDYAFATDLYEDLDGVIITYKDTGEELDYDAIEYDEEMERIRQEAYADDLGNKIDYAMMGD